ncbi:hypothetical protein EV361DRAFT_953570 [Lentinula raphanica]|nr:hypothetical protein EV361DRAFT_953570 [Lentinula raphanica]
MEDLDGPLSASYWEHGTGEHNEHWRCIACPDQPWFTNLGHAHCHRATTKHRQSMQFILRTSEQSTPNPLELNPSISSRVRGPLVDLLHNIQASASSHLPDIDIDMVELPPLGSAMSMAMGHLAKDLESFLLDNDSVSQSLDDSVPNEQVPEFESFSNDPVAFGQRRPAQRSKAAFNPEWFPWPDKAVCAIFQSASVNLNIELILWALDAFGVNNAPSVDVMKSVNDYLQSLCGIHTKRYTGALGHVYYMNDLGRIIRQEMGNPLIQKHLHHYPEDTMATPMIWKDAQDFYVFEITHLTDGQLVVPFRWFTRGRHGIPSEVEQDFYALAWTVESNLTARGYHVNQNHILEFPVSSLLSSLPRIIESFVVDGIFDPRNIQGVIKTGEQDPVPWTYTTADDGFMNHWRSIFVRCGQADGYWAWDVECQEMVFVFPSVLAMLGDNPMQRKDADDESPDIHTSEMDDNASIQSDTSEVLQSGGKWKRRIETMAELVARAKQFLGSIANKIGNCYSATKYFQLRL